jgi:small-conductance mechanosensitive channel
VAWDPVALPVNGIIGTLDYQRFMNDQLLRWAEMALGDGTRLLAILLIALLLNRLLRAFTRRLVQSSSGSGGRTAQMHEQQTRTLAGVLYSAGTAVIASIALLLALPVFGFNVTPLAAAAGLASLAVGFGGQHLVRDVINGFFIVFEDQYVVGDTVRIGDITGRVEHLTLRRTVVRDGQGAIVSIPNGEIGRVANLNRDWGQLLLDTIIATDQPLDRATAAIDGVAAEFRADAAWAPTLIDGPRLLGVESQTSGGISLRLQARTVPMRQDDVARELRRRIHRALASNGIRMDNVQRIELGGQKPKEEALQ